MHAAFEPGCNINCGETRQGLVPMHVALKPRPGQPGCRAQKRIQCPQQRTPKKYIDRLSKEPVIEKEIKVRKRLMHRVMQDLKDIGKLPKQGGRTTVLARGPICQRRKAILERFQYPALAGLSVVSTASSFLTCPVPSCPISAITGI